MVHIIQKALRLFYFEIRDTTTLVLQDLWSLVSSILVILLHIHSAMTNSNNSNKTVTYENENHSLNEDVGFVKFLRSLDATRRRVLLYVAVVNLLSFAALSLLFPFFTAEAGRKGMSTSVIGLVFSSYSFVMAVAAPVWGRLIPKLGAGNVVTIGAFVNGTCNVIFGLLAYITRLDAFTAMCFVTRCVEALGASAIATGGYSIFAEQFTEHVGTAIGFLETCVTVGLSIGPLIGSLLYELGHYGLPFWTIGGTMFFYGFLLNGRLPATKERRSSAPMRKFLKSARIWIVGLIIISNFAWYMVVQTCLQPHLAELGLTESEVSMFFLLLSLVSCVAYPILGYISDKSNKDFLVILVGMVIMVIGMLLIGPSPFFSSVLQSTIWLNIVSLILIGTGASAAFIPTYKCLMDATIEDCGFQPGIQTYGIVAGFFSSSICIGEVVGALLGGILVESYSFPIATTVVAIVELVLVVVVGIFFAMYRREHTDEDKQDDHEQDMICEYSALMKEV